MDYTLLLEFYDTYLVTRGESTIRKVNYSDIIRCVETDTHFYLKYRDQTCHPCNCQSVGRGIFDSPDKQIHPAAWNQ